MEEICLPEIRPYGIYYSYSILPPVGAMKIARNVAVFEWYVEWYAPHPGSLSEGAGTPAGRD